MGLFSGLQNKSAAVHLEGTLLEFVLPSLKEAQSRGLGTEIGASLSTAISGARTACARASSKGQLSVAETMLGRMLLLRKSDMITSATHSLIGIYIASAKRAELYPEFAAEFEGTFEKARAVIFSVCDGCVVSELNQLNRMIGLAAEEGDLGFLGRLFGSGDQARVSSSTACLDYLRLVLQEAGREPASPLSADLARNRPFIGGVLGLVDFYASKNGEPTRQVAAQVMTDLFGPSARDALETVATGAQSMEQIDAMIAVQEQLHQATTRADTLRALQTLKKHL